MTDKEKLDALFKIVCALSERITGQRLAMHTSLAGAHTDWLTTENALDIVDWSPLPISSVDAEPQSSQG